MKLNCLTGHELLEQLRSGKVSGAQIVSDLKARYEAVEPQVRAFARPPFFDRVAAAKPSGGVLAGIPVVVKDNICSDGDLTECASRILAGFVAPYDATVIVKMKDAGALLMAKANQDEFAFGSSCESSCFYPTRNPWNLECVPVGSSGGSAASVAADLAIMSLGSDTGGSIRQPASLCGIVGMKPTYGRVSRFGLIAFASSLDQIGPLTKDVRDNALLLRVIAGHDPKDSTSADLAVPDYTLAFEKDLKGMCVGLPKEYFVEGIDPEVRQSMDQAVAVLKAKGAVVKEVSLPNTPYAVAVYYIVATAEASSNLARFDGVQYGLRVNPKAGEPALVSMYKQTRGQGFGPEAKRRIILGTYVLSSGYYDAYYARALKVRTLIKNDFDKVFKDCDLIVTPTSPTAAFKIGSKADDPLSMYLSDIYTISANLAGIPGLSLPCGFTKSGLPIGMQILGKPFGEEDIYRLAYAYEQATEWHKVKPKL
jgi:aspartyl-tRNA(Asn)/glutamyl-tRNA(Gln) amidotransferase subunit A